MGSATGEQMVGAFVKALLTVFLAALSAAAVQAQAPPPPPLRAGSPQAAGRQIFVTRCATCHGTNAMGGEFSASAMAGLSMVIDPAGIGSMV